MITIDDVTGRDGYILAKALSLAVAIVPHLPREYQALSDRSDMQKMLKALFPKEAEWYMDMAANTVASVEESYRRNGEP